MTTRKGNGAASQRSSSGSSLLRTRASFSSITGTPSRTGKANRSARHISTDAAASWRSGDLHKGQARISSSLASSITLFLSQARLQQGKQARGMVMFELDRHPQMPHPVGGELRAFYGI